MKIATQPHQSCHPRVPLSDPLPGVHIEVDWGGRPKPCLFHNIFLITSSCHACFSSLILGGLLPGIRSERLRPCFSHRFPFEFKGIGSMDKPIQDGIGERGIPDAIMPFRPADLGGQDGRSKIVAVLQDLEEVLTVFRGHGGQGEVFEDEDVLAGQGFQEGVKLPRAPGDLCGLEETGEADEEDVVSQATGLVPQSFAM